MVIDQQEIDRLEKGIGQSWTSLRHLHFYCKTGAFRLRLEPQVTAIAADHRARDVQPEARALRARLKRLKEALGRGNSRTGVAETNPGGLLFDGDGNRQFARGAILDSSIAVLRN